MELKTYWNPDSLYDKSIRCYVENLKLKISHLDEIDELQILPPDMIADMYLVMSETEDLADVLFNQLSNLTIFTRLLKHTTARIKITKCFSILMCNDRQISTEISSKFVMYTQHHFQPYCKTSPPKNSNHNFLMSRDMCLKQIENGMRLGSFLCESGWLQDSLKVLTTTLSVINTVIEPKMNLSSIIMKFDCLQRLLHTEVAFCCFTSAIKTQMEANEIIDEFGIEKIPISLIITYYKVLSMFHLAKSDYKLSYEWGVQALKFIGPTTPAKLVIDVLRITAKACVVNREFDKARILILKAVKLASDGFGQSHQKYADTLLDYGFFLLNVDDIVRSVRAYSRALEIKRSVHGNKNLNVATAEEDLSYALYVLEYSSGKFERAKEHICKSIKILRTLLPTDHLLLSSAQRVKALILEEIALDGHLNQNNEYQDYLLEAEELHQSALKITIEAFGEVNVQTAKHYGNLGRLYQSMAKYEEAEELHKRSIKIKSDLLGSLDYEVGLSIGHLASLYSYHMQKYHEAEELYLKSIAISLRLFGESYSGLEYDYKGLCNVYEFLNDTEKYLQYSQILEIWRIIRDENRGVSTSCNEPKEDLTLDEVREKFFDLCKYSVIDAETDNE